MGNRLIFLYLVLLRRGATGGHPGRRSCTGRSAGGAEPEVTRGGLFAPFVGGVRPVKVGFWHERKDACPALAFE